MSPRKTTALVLAAIATVAVATAAAPQTQAPWILGDDPWREDPVWHDGKAEKCVYEATREIYGVAREYEAIAYTNKQIMDPKTTTKAEGDRGHEVFKHHWSERVPTENYDYDFSTATFTRTDTMSLYKMTVATQEDCGASFKQAWRDGPQLRWWDSVYFPGAGVRTGELSRANYLHATDELSLLLRDIDFDSGHDLDLQLVPSQKSTGQVPWFGRRYTLFHNGREKLDLPVGELEAYHIELRTFEGESVGHYWFAAEAGAPWLHALVAYEGADGTRYRLKSIERTAYWRG